MQISLVSINEDFIKFIEGRNAGIQILNRYTTLSDERELQRFNNDFNHVNLFMFIDFQDLSKEFKEFLNYIHNGKSYFLNTEEVLLVTWKDPLLSPTPDLEKNLEAISAFMENLNYKLRIVRLDSLKFQDIYKSITVSDSVKDSSPKQLIKYKVLNSNEGEMISPKKANATIIPDKLIGKGSVHKKEDLESAQSLDNTVINVPSVIEPLRMEKDFKDHLSLALTDTTVIFISGIRYSGKTSIALKIAKELEEQNLSSVVVDLTARKDIRLLNKEVKCDLTMLKGLNIETASKDKKVIGVNVYNKVYTSSFLTNLLRSITTGRAITLCEVDPEQLPIIYKSFRGNKAALIITPNNQIMLRDTVALANKWDFAVVPVINKAYKTKQEINSEHLRDAVINARVVHDVENITDLVTSILR